MKFISIFVVTIVLALTVQSLPADQNFKVVAGDKRDLHDLCGRWFCGHTKREKIPSTVQIEAPITNSNAKIEEQTLHEQPLTVSDKREYEQPSTISDKRDLHDLCGRWFCGHTKKRSIILRDYLRSAIEGILPNSSS
ncbi:hypothetical protein K7432_013236 [Basidiobolus ranarum]|uniref:Uncharacterized protein n=1 Tax=Basidiobolus ranarum TaxID=34480 RepID=A0ABR2WJH5_9FUNG